MRKNRIAYVSLIILLLVLTIIFEKTFLFYTALIMIVLAAVIWGLLGIDAKNIKVKMSVIQSGQVGKRLPLQISIETNGFRLLCAKNVVAETDIHNAMLGKTQSQRMVFELRSSANVFEYESEILQCGCIKITCDNVYITDIFGLFSVKTSHFKISDITVYPENINLSVILSKATIGATKDDGFMQNRKGSDPSEMYDIREYVPGDDLRSIHWKLSGKMDNLILRQASEPTHYQAILMPDFGFDNVDGRITYSEINKAASVCFEMGKQLLKNGVVFCMAVPQKNGLRLNEVRSEIDFQNVITGWLGVRLPKKGGLGLKYFLMEHLEQKFTRLIIVSAGRYAQDLSILNEQIGVLTVSVVENISQIHSDMNGTCEMVEIPAEGNIDENYQIVC